MCRCEALDDAQLIRFRQLVEDEEEVDINCTDTTLSDEYGFTPLIWLCALHQSDDLFVCVDLLLKRPDIEINQTGKGGLNALMVLCLLSTSDQISKVAQLLIEKGIDVNQTNEDGWNALMHLCYHSKSDQIVEMVKLLIDNGINVNQTDIDGKNAGYYLNGNESLSKSEKREIVVLMQQKQ